MRLQFGPFTLDSGTRQLIRDDTEIRLSPKAFDVLCTLIEHRPKVVKKAELHARIWPRTFVVDTNLSILIAEIRRAVSDTPEQPRFIRTVHKVGYAFCGSATDLDDAPSNVPMQSTKCWLGSNARTFALSAGDNIIGRDPHCSVWLDASGVSRQHARIHIAGAGADASIDDLASTNGTFVGGSQVVARQRLKDGDVIQIGSVELMFRVWSADTLKKTDRIRRRPS